MLHSSCAEGPSELQETPGCSAFTNSYNKNDDNSIVVVSGEFEIGYTDVKEDQFFLWERLEL